MTSTAPLILAAVSIPALVWADIRQWRPGRYLCKPLAAVAFVWLAWNLGAVESRYGQWLLAGLVLCLVGDLLLMFDSERSFLGGLAAFLCGHLLYVVAFTHLPISAGGLAWSTPLVLLLLVFSGRWLAPHVDGAMRLPVFLYMAVISAMLLAASLTAKQPAALYVIPGAIGFALSDLAVARQQFIVREARNGLWGTPLYFVSQLLLAASLSTL